MRITWVTRSFLDYRIPIYKKLSELNNDEFYLIYCDEEHVNPKRVRDKIKLVLGDRAIGMKGEKCFGTPYNPEHKSNEHIRVCWQPNLIKTIKRTNPNVIITDAFNNWTLPVFFLKICGYKFKHILCYERTKHTERTAGKLKLKFISIVKRWIDYVHVNGILCKEFLLSLGYNESMIRMGNMSADTAGLISQLKDINKSDYIELYNKFRNYKVRFLFVGQYIERKGVIPLLKAWEKANIKDACLILIGKGGLKTNINNLINENHLTNVFDMGSVDYDKIALYYKLADCFIIPTIEDNWSLVVPEAMSCKLPILSSIYNGCWPEFVTKKNGWVFDTFNEDSVIDAIKVCYNSRDKLKEMGEESYRIVQDFTPEKNAQKIYNSCL